jgi:hypothetical protein
MKLEKYITGVRKQLLMASGCMAMLSSMNGRAFDQAVFTLFIVYCVACYQEAKRERAELLNPSAIRKQ